MKPAKLYIPKDLHELLDFVISMKSKAPTFKDRTGYFPFLNLDWIFRELTEGLSLNRPMLGEARYQELMLMMAQIRTLFEADPEDKTGQTTEGYKIIHQMEDILVKALRNS